VVSRGDIFNFYLRNSHESNRLAVELGYVSAGIGWVQKGAGMNIADRANVIVS